jgi:electron transport complex protein RnfC
VCPAGLNPSKLADYAEVSNEVDFIKWQGEFCISCGCCTYKCPSKRKLKDTIQSMNENILLNKENGGEERETNI